MEKQIIVSSDDAQNPYLILERQRPIGSDIFEINAFIKEINYDIDPLFVDDERD